MNICPENFIINHPLYPMVQGVINDLKKQNLIQHGSGFCLAMSDVISSLLHKVGIHSRLIECELTLTSSNPPAFHVVGLQTAASPTADKLATHIVVVVEHEIPLIIDASVGHLLPNPYTWVCAPLSVGIENELARFSNNEFTLTYRPRTNSNFPLLHQQSILDRIKTDKRIEKSINQNHKLLTVVAVLTGLLILSLAHNYWYTWAVDQEAAIRYYKNAHIIEENNQSLKELSERIKEIKK